MDCERLVGRVNSSGNAALIDTFSDFIFLSISVLDSAWFEECGLGLGL